MNVNFSNNLYFKYDGLIKYSTDNTNWTNVTSYPITLTYIGGSTGTIFLNTNILFDTNNKYFIIGSNNITINGQYYKVILNDILNYPGLIQNGSNTNNGYNNININNIFTNSTGTTTLNIGAGWVCQSYFSKNASNCTVSYCSSDGDISTEGGGIAGSYTENTEFDKCYSTGQIGNYAGGIVGTYSSIISVYNSYSLGLINIYGGGILGAYHNSIVAGTSTCSACYSIGYISNNGGGIVGAYSNSSNDISFITAVNCYSVGNIDTNAGGIFGSDANDNTTSSMTNADNCYVVGFSASSNWFYGSNPTRSSVSASYSEGAVGGSSWTDNHANIVLQNISTTWTSYVINQPYLLTNFNRNIYNGATSANVIFGNSTTLTLSHNIGNTFNILSVDDTINNDVTINSSTGQITSVYDITMPYTISIKILNGNISSPAYNYSITNLLLTVLAIPCYLEGTQILALIDNIEQYIKIEDLKIGMTLKTYKDGYIKIKYISHYFNAESNNDLYKIFYIKEHDLYLTGGHSILVNYINANENKKMSKYRKIEKKIHDKYLLLACAYKDAQNVFKKGKLYHIVLESNNINKQYGIWSNGLLTETMSIKYSQKC